MGYKVSDPITLTDVLNLETSQYEDLSMSKFDISKRPDYQILQAQQKLLDIDVNRMKWGYLPTLAAYGSYQYNAQRSTFNFLEFDKNDLTKQWYKISLVGVTLNLNIFTGFQRMNRIEQAKITSMKNLNTIKNIEMAAEMEATSASISYNNAYASVQSQKKNMDLAQHVYDVVQKKYQGGVGTNLEVVTAETSLKEAQTNYYNAIYDMMVAKIDYQKATGTLTK
jgi:outer membrane protein TolC